MKGAGGWGVRAEKKEKIGFEQSIVRSGERLHKIKAVWANKIFNFLHFGCYRICTSGYNLKL